MQQNPQNLLNDLAQELPELTPEMRKAAAYILDNPQIVSVSSIREMASAAQVKPNTLVRVARSIGYSGYEEFREPFRDEIKRGGRAAFPDRARWLQSLSKGGQHAELFAGMADSSLTNVQESFANTDADKIKAAADAIVDARRTYVLGVGLNHGLASSFAYLADMALDDVIPVPREGGLPADDLVRASPGDVLLAMTFRPYRNDVIEVVDYARQKGLTLIGISDSLASPVIAASHHGFVVATESPQFFTSTVALVALLETLLAFVVADSDADVVASIQTFHERRTALGIYRDD